MIRILINPCWPFSGSKYQVWKGDKCILETSQLHKAQQIAEEQE